MYFFILWSKISVQMTTFLGNEVPQFLNFSRLNYGKKSPLTLVVGNSDALVMKLYLFAFMSSSPAVANVSVSLGKIFTLNCQVTDNFLMAALWP